MIRVDDHSKLKDSEGFGINGTLVDFTLIKSRTNRAGSVATLVLNQEIGFDEELSLFYLLKENGKVNGAGAYLYIGDRNDIKFSQKNFKEKLRDSKELQQIFMTEVMNVLKAMLDTSSDDYDRQEDTTDSSISSNILDMINDIAA